MSLINLNEALEHKYNIDSTQDVDEGLLDLAKSKLQKVYNNKLEDKAKKLDMQHEYVDARDLRWMAAEDIRKAEYQAAQKEPDMEMASNKENEAMKDYQNRVAEANNIYKDFINTKLLTPIQAKFQTINDKDSALNEYKHYRNHFKSHIGKNARVDDYFYVELEKIYKKRLNQIKYGRRP